MWGERGCEEKKWRKQLLGLNIDNSYYERLYGKGATQTRQTAHANEPKASAKNMNVPDNLPIQ